MTEVFMTVRELGTAIERALQAGGGRALNRLADQWVAGLDAIVGSGVMPPDAGGREFVRRFTEWNERWVAMAVEGKKVMAEELGRTARARRQCGMIRKKYVAPPSAKPRIRGRG